MRGLNNEQMAVMRKCGPAGAPPVCRATWREYNVILRLIDRGLIYNEPSPHGPIARVTAVGALILQTVLSNRLVKQGF